MKAFRVDFNGKISGFYSDGTSDTIATVALALFQNPRRLQRVSGDIFVQSEFTGEPYLGPAQSEIRGRIYSGSIEELDETLYGMNVDK